MSQFTGLLSATGLGSIQNLGGGADVTPNAVNWGTILANYIAFEWTSAIKQITGINQTIKLKVNMTLPAGAEIYYSVVAPANIGSYPADNTPQSTYMGSDFGAPISNNGTFTVQNNDYVYFGIQADGVTTSTGSFTVTVKNASDGDAILDTFDATWNAIV